MARTRTITLALFRDERVMNIDPVSQMLFMAFWCFSDRCDVVDMTVSDAIQKTLPFRAEKFSMCIDELLREGFISGGIENDRIKIHILDARKWYPKP